VQGRVLGVQLILDTTPPTLSNATFDYLTAQTVRFTFGEDVLASLAAGDFIVTNTDTNVVVPAGEFTFSATGGSGVASIATLTHNSSAEILADGHYGVAISNVSDAAGNPLAPTNWPFFVLAADANHNHTVDSIDFNILAANFGLAPRDFSQGDFNYNTTVDTIDFNLLANNFGKSILGDASAIAHSAAVAPAVRPQTVAVATPTVAMFGAEPIVNENSLDELLNYSYGASWQTTAAFGSLIVI